MAAARWEDAVVPPRSAALILAAGASSRFGSPKALARLDGRPILEHVLDAVREAGIDRIVVVLGQAAEEIEAGVEWVDEQVVRNPDPRHLSSSLQVGMDAIEALDPPVESVIVALGDQPRTRPEVIHALLVAARGADRPVIVPRYAGGGGANPVLLRRAAFDLVDEASGDQGLGPVLAERADLVLEVAVDGTNPDVDTPGDLAALVWADRVRANREQVDRLREVADGADFYRAVSGVFRADPLRSGDRVLEALRRLVEPGDVWLDIGAGAGRYALPLALDAREVVALDPSPAMLDVLRDLMREHGIGNVRPIEGRWPPAAGDELRRKLGPDPCCDVALIAHVGYDIEAIGPFLDAMEAAARRACVAVLMERPPASVAEPFWPRVHEEPRAALPALGEFLALLRARGAEPGVAFVDGETHRYPSRDELVAFLRRQLWIAGGGEKERRFEAAFEELVLETPDGWGLRDQPLLSIGVVTWHPAAARRSP